jgi:type II secretory pathway pseudopilin PulG
MRAPDARFLTSIAGIALAGILIVAVFIALSGVSGNQNGQYRDIQLAAIRRAALQCYALEGAYPPSLQYLVEQYGLILDTKDYQFRYEVPAGNLPPIVEVFPNG